jgi:alanine racemase
MELLKRTWAEVSLDNLAFNYHQLRANVPETTRFLGVVKADAYGHGAVPVARELERLGADFFAASNVEEAMQLREGGPTRPILIFGYTPPQYAPWMAAHGVRQEVNCLDYARALSDAMSGSDQTLRVHLKLDTGMTRLGFFAYDRPETLPELVQTASLPGLLAEGAFAHFAVADSKSPEDIAYTHQQFARFQALLAELAKAGVKPEICHHANSAGAICYPEYALDMIRPGIATYGLAPSDELEGNMELRPLMALRTTIAQIRTVPSGVSISYGRTYTTPAARRIAVLTIGYADGLPRRLSNRGEFLLHGRRVPVVGRICMDMCMVDVTDVPEAVVGDTVTIFGRDGDAFIPIEELARELDTISYELLCGINKRVPRVYLQNGKVVDTLQYIV